MEALLGAYTKYGLAHRRDCDCSWRDRRSAMGRVGPLADGHIPNAVAFLRGPLGGDMVPELAAPAPSRRPRRSGRGASRGVVRWWNRFSDWHASDRDRVRRVPAGALA